MARFTVVRSQPTCLQMYFMPAKQNGRDGVMNEPMKSSAKRWIGDSCNWVTRLTHRLCMRRYGATSAGG